MPRLAARARRSSMPNSAARKSSRCGATAISSSDSALRSSASGRRARGGEACRQRGIGGAQMRDEPGVDARGALDRVEVGEREAVRERKLWHDIGRNRRGKPHKTVYFTAARRLTHGVAAAYALEAVHRRPTRRIMRCRRLTCMPAVRPFGARMTAVRIVVAAAALARRRFRRRPDDQARRAQQLQGLSGVPRAVQEGDGARAGRDQCRRRRARPQARGRDRATTTARRATPCAWPRSSCRARRSRC